MLNEFFMQGAASPYQKFKLEIGHRYLDWTKSWRKTLNLFCEAIKGLLHAYFWVNIADFNYLCQLWINIVVVGMCLIQRTNIGACPTYWPPPSPNTKVLYGRWHTLPSNVIQIIDIKGLSRFTYCSTTLPSTWQRFLQPPCHIVWEFSSVSI